MAAVALRLDQSDSLAGRVLAGQGHQRYLSTPQGLREASLQIAKSASELGCSNVMAASPHAGGALAVAVLLNPNLRQVGLRELRSSEVDKVLLVETVAVSGMRIQKSIAAAREAGANWVGVLVLFPVLTGDGGDVCEALGLHTADVVYVA